MKVIGTRIEQVQMSKRLMKRRTRHRCGRNLRKSGANPYIEGLGNTISAPKTDYPTWRPQHTQRIAHEQEDHRDFDGVAGRFPQIGMGGHSLDFVTSRKCTAYAQEPALKPRIVFTPGNAGLGVSTCIVDRRHRTVTLDIV